MFEYKMKDSVGYSPRTYVQPSVSYFDGIVEATEKTMTAMVATAAAVGLALLSVLTTSRASDKPLER
jgi:hypothetical protein